MAELLGTISAIIGIAGACVTLGQKLTDCIDTVSYAEDDVEIIISEVNIFSGLLTSFASVMKELDVDQKKASALVQAVTQQDLVTQIHQQSNLVKGRIKEFLKKLRSLDPNNGSSMIQRSIGRLQWYFGKSEFIFLKTFLDAAKSNIQLLLTLVLLATYMDSHKNKQAFELYGPLRLRCGFAEHADTTTGSE